jgi:hypothetical protein
MSVLSSDTAPASEQIQIDLIRRMPAWKKLAAVAGMNAMVRTLALAGIRGEVPDAPPGRVRRLLTERALGPELARRVYGDGG